MRAIIRYLKRDILNTKNNLLFLIAFAIFYGIEALFLHGEPLTGYGNYRVTVFLPALIGVAFGPMSGAFVAGVGNLIYDVINKLFIKHEPLHLKHLIGFIGNFVGGYVVGALSVDIDVRKKGLFTKESMVDYLWNTFASIIGLAGVTGFIIGFGNLLIGEVNTLAEALIFAGTIAVWNSIFLMSLLIVLPLYGYIEKRSIEKRIEKMRAYERMKITPISSGPYVSIVGAKILENIPTEREWSLLSITVKNKHREPTKYKIELVGPDIIMPSTLFTKTIAPNQVDEVTFSIYPINDGERQLKIRIIPWERRASEIKKLIEKTKKTEFLLEYKARPEESEKISSLTSIIGILVIFSLLAKAIYDLINTKSISIGLSVAISLFIAEITLILLWYFYKKYSFRTS